MVAGAPGALCLKLPRIQITIFAAALPTVGTQCRDVVFSVSAGDLVEIGPSPRVNDTVFAYGICPLQFSALSGAFPLVSRLLGRRIDRTNRRAGA